MSELAMKGGSPVIQPGEFKSIPWPPVDEETGEMLKELYFSGKWSFNSEAEQKFEQEFADYHNAKYGIFMTNGTVTLECALRALGIGPGDEVIVPGLTWIATAMAVVYTGAAPVFADVERDTVCLSPEAFERAITPKTRAVIPVHLYGGMADLDRIMEIAGKHGISVIEDCAHMHGGKWNGRGAGSWGAVGSFSFQQSKCMTSGEGGICITSDPKLADLLYRCKHIGYSRMDEQGGAKSAPPMGLECHNFRGLAMAALILSRQLKQLPARIERYNAFAAAMEEAIRDIPGVTLQKRGRLAGPQGYYRLMFIFDPAVWGTGLQAAAALQAEGLPVSSRNYGPVTKHMLFNTEKFRDTGCPNAEFLGEQALGLSHNYMDCLANVSKTAEALRKVFEHRDEIK